MKYLIILLLIVMMLMPYKEGFKPCDYYCQMKCNDLQTIRKRYGAQYPKGTSLKCNI